MTSRWLFLLALLVQFVVLYLPRAPGAAAVPGTDKAVHVAVFAVPTLLGLLAGWRAWVVVPLLAVHGLLSELVQWLWLPHRGGSVGDAVADLCGVALGVAAYLAVVRVREGNRRW